MLPTATFVKFVEFVVVSAPSGSAETAFACNSFDGHRYGLNNSALVGRKKVYEFDEFSGLYALRPDEARVVRDTNSTDSTNPAVERRRLTSPNSLNS